MTALCVEAALHTKHARVDITNHIISIIIMVTIQMRIKVRNVLQKSLSLYTA